MDRTAVFPGSFDPFTLGHQSIAERALRLCGVLIIAVGSNIAKNASLPPEERRRRIAEVFAGEGRIAVAVYAGLTIDFCRQMGASLIIRGVRNADDCRSEMFLAQANRQIDPSIETILLASLPEHTGISSSAAREIIASGGNADAMLPRVKQVKFS